MFADFLSKFGNPFGRKPTKQFILVQGQPANAVNPLVGGVGLQTVATAKPATGFGAWLQRLLGKVPQAGPGTPLAGGHRGKALGDLRNPDTSAANIEKWKPLTPEEAEGYVEGGVFSVHSTNVFEFEYFPKKKELKVIYDAKDGRGQRGYMYSQISEAEMRLIVAAQSKGGVAWTLLIGRRSQGFSRGNPRKPVRRLF